LIILIPQILNFEQIFLLGGILDLEMLRPEWNTYKSIVKNFFPYFVLTGTRHHQEFFRQIAVG